MGVDATAVVAVYASPLFESSVFRDFLWGMSDIYADVGAEYIGCDLVCHQELTVAMTALGRTNSPVFRSGASPDGIVCLIRMFGRSTVALHLFEHSGDERVNDFFRFTPWVATSQTVATKAMAMIDSSNGLRRLVHHLAEVSDYGFAIETPLPFDGAVDPVAADERTRRNLGAFFDEDFELVFTVPAEELHGLRSTYDVCISRIRIVMK